MSPNVTVVSQRGSGFSARTMQQFLFLLPACTKTEPQQQESGARESSEKVACTDKSHKCLPLQPCRHMH